jgi:MSHA biogenesis protein MshP
MCPNYSLTNTSVKISTQRGSMLVIALFVIIVLALLGLTMTRLLSSSSETIIHEVLGQRAANAARAGIDCAVAAQFGDGCNFAEGKTFNGVAGIENCWYQVTKTQKSIKDGNKNFIFWTFSSTGHCQAGNINVTRTVYTDAIEAL